MINATCRSSVRLHDSRRGTMLVVVLGLLVALFVIGTSFSYITLAERKASTNYLDRQRALDLALDGVEYSIARLRAESTRQHYEELSDAAFEYSPDKRDIDGSMFARKNLDSRDVRVSWNKASTNTNESNDSPDRNWVDFNNNGKVDGNETGFGGDKMPGNVSPGSRNFLSGVTLFGGEGVRIDSNTREGRQFADGKNYGVSGTYEDLGDYTRVKVIDAASQLNLNNFKTERLTEVLLVLGIEIDKWVSGGEGTGKYNPFTAKIVEAIARTHEESGNFFSNKEQLRPIWDGSSLDKSPELYDLAMNFVTVNNWRDPGYRDFADTAGKIVEDKAKNPSGTKLEMELKREGFSKGQSNIGGQDGWPDWQADAGTGLRAPVNVNTAPKPVLVALFAGLTARARLLYFKKAAQIAEEDRLYKDLFAAAPNRLVYGTPDLGRQNNQPTEGMLNAGGGENQAIFQLVPIGPITSAAGAKATGTNLPAGQDYASKLADIIIELRRTDPFKSWQDFDNRFCYLRLLNMTNSRLSIKTGDVVNARRSSIADPGDLSGINAEYLPLADNCKHQVNPLTSTDAAMSQNAFRAWYWKSVVDMIRANLNPNNVVNRYNSDYPYHQNVDRMDLVTTSCPVCFSSMGMYEVVSQGEILAPTARGMNIVSTETTAGGAATARMPIARRQVRTLVEIYTVLRHSSQYDFMKPIDPDLIASTATAVAGTSVSRNIVAMTRFGTSSGPYSADEKEAGAWIGVDESDKTVYPEDTVYLGVRRKGGYNAHANLSRDFGYISQEGQDRTPFTSMASGLNFHARFNEGLDARESNTATNPTGIFGLNSSNKTSPLTGNQPLDKDAIFDDFINTATPRRVDPAYAGGPTEFADSDKGDEATRYATLVSDGVFMRGSAIRMKYRSPAALQQSYGARGKNRFGRLKLLRYRCGANLPNSPFDPIHEGAGNDGTQIGAGSDATSVRTRLSDLNAPFSGTDDHNRTLEDDRQKYANCPYYEGTIDMWIKWDFPAQGNDRTPDPVTSCMGEIDPASHNFSGLFGATAFGRSNTLPTSATAADTSSLSFAQANPMVPRDAACDIEGVQFFIFKEPGGFLRFSRMYFSEAFAQDFPNGIGYAGGTVVPFGKAMRRIIDESDAAGMNVFTGTNDICPRNNTYDDKGFKYARTDGWVNLSDIATTIPALRVHDWHRLTLSYNSNSLNQPYDLWIDGRKIAVEFHADDPANPKGFLNDGHHEPNPDAAIPATDPAQTEYLIYRTTSKLLEINPEDRLTIGCLFRRQLDPTDVTPGGQFETYFKEDQADSATVKQSRPLFKFDANLLAVANATIDDVRISQNGPQPSDTADQSACAQASRYLQRAGINASAPDCFFEQGFLPANPNGASGSMLTAPVRLGTLSWTEYRPDWDPYMGRGIDLAKSARVIVQWAVFDDISKVKQTNGMVNFSDATSRGQIEDAIGTDPKSANYWAAGGMPLNGAKLNAGQAMGVIIYRVHFVSPEAKDVPVANVSAYLDDVTLTVLTPPRKLAFVIEY